VVVVLVLPVVVVEAPDRVVTVVDVAPEPVVTVSMEPPEPVVVVMIVSPFEPVWVVIISPWKWSNRSSPISWSAIPLLLSNSPILSDLPDEAVVELGPDISSFEPEDVYERVPDTLDAVVAVVIELLVVVTAVAFLALCCVVLVVLNVT